jgi:hypothetical protein
LALDEEFDDEFKESQENDEPPHLRNQEMDRTKITTTSRDSEKYLQ